MATVRTIIELVDLVSSKSLSIEQRSTTASQVSIIITAAGQSTNYVLDAGDTIVWAQNLLRTAAEAKAKAT